MNYLLQLDSTECSEFYAVEVNQKNWEERMEVIESEFVKYIAYLVEHGIEIWLFKRSIFRMYQFSLLFTSLFFSLLFLV